MPATGDESGPTVTGGPAVLSTRPIEEQRPAPYRIVTVHGVSPADGDWLCRGVDRGGRPVQFAVPAARGRTVLDDVLSEGPVPVLVPAGHVLEVLS